MGHKVTNVDDIRDAILAATDGKNIGLVIAALGQAVRIVYRQIDLSLPHLSDQARKDFEEHVKGPKDDLQ